MNAATLTAVRNVTEVIAAMHAITFGRVGFLFTTASGSKYAIVRDNVGRVAFDTDSVSLPREYTFGVVREAVLDHNGSLVIVPEDGPRITTSRVMQAEPIVDMYAHAAVA